MFELMVFSGNGAGDIENTWGRGFMLGNKLFLKRKADPFLWNKFQIVNGEIEIVLW